MFGKKEKVQEKEGKPWKVLRKTKTFQEADLERKKISAEKEFDVKVKFSSSQNLFFVKVRKK